MPAFKTDSLNMWTTLNLCLLILILTGAYLGETGQQLIHTQTKTADLNNSIVPMRDLFEALLNMETGQRGYLLSENEKFLEPYNEAHDLVKVNVAKLIESSETDTNVKKILPAVITLVGKKTAVMQHTIDLQQQGKHTEAVAMIKTGIGKQYMDDFRKAILPLTNQYREKRLALSIEATSLIKKIYVAAGACSFILLLIIAIGFRSLYLSLNRLKLANQTITRIVDIQAAITKDLNILRVMQIAADSAQTLTNATGAVIEIIEGDDMVYKTTSGIAAPYLDIRLKKEGSLSGLCVKTDNILQCDDSETDERVDRNACRKIGLRSMLVVPLKRLNETVGVLKVLSEKPAKFSTTDSTILQLIAGFIGTAMYNANAYEYVQRESLHDGLTGLPNRRLFHDRAAYQLSQLQRTNTSLAVLYMDLDGFKPINDTYGHQIGDELLLAVAERMRQTLRQSDTAARLGGDEFAILAVSLPSIDDAKMIAERFRSAIEDEPFNLSVGAVTIGVSIGIAITEGSAALPIDELFNQADIAMYNTKRERKAS